MQHITDEMVDRHVAPEDVQRIMLEAFRSFGQGNAAMQQRIRTEAGGVKLSTLGAVIPEQGVAGAKVYTTIDGQFSFVILLFSTEDGRPLASFDAGAITRLRTAACTVVAARHLARPDARTLALFGAGTQGAAHARQLSAALPLERILLCDPYAPADLPERLSQSCGIPVLVTENEAAVREADIVVTASRSTTPLFSGQAIKPGAFVAAIGSSLPHTRELDDVALSRASAVVVEWKPQSTREAGDIVMAGQGVLPESKLVELADVVLERAQPRRSDDDIVIYKSVGVGLEDVALAGLAWQRVQAAAR
ncbi:ornithine cyclodeaminase family protein [Cupriavidus gilardii]|uniref:Ornithine cyclodeaminase family protein n=1 Tax=Cupriavidus gilardii TaxID=82541 RepID=A0A849B7J2_9BURK|nr:ornithine cyclodeaminase family protein [Cupriavidus gilardii]KAB0594881.1 ornithine cyclodeaminase family protein [Cupriavidus gilardii]MCT9014232.1 ornithine cyclodeaminase family protein [Cupriavidus gilardii]MCT9053952.1 ornithine cyclodeaminase family protein [Cupriavidus gilardii]NNH11631.1 ornithine cyclodeaminase family protein [Cupriavidus gilardii]WNG68612.1 ornithine cyclodeaminase family protein [Cupriavidus gilardii]